MNRIKKFLRLAGLVCLIVLASMGVGIPMLMNSREKYQDRAVRIELVEVREDEAESEQEEAKK